MFFLSEQSILLLAALFTLTLSILSTKYVGAVVKFSSDLKNTMVQLQIPRPGEQQMTYEQTQAVYIILSNYDSESFTQKDFYEIICQFEEAEIPLGNRLKTLVEKAGFNFESISNRQ